MPRGVTAERGAGGGKREGQVCGRRGVLRGNSVYSEERECLICFSHVLLFSSLMWPDVCAVHPVH